MRVNLDEIKNGIVLVKNSSIYTGMPEAEYKKLIGTKETSYSKSSKGKYPTCEELTQEEAYEFNAKITPTFKDDKVAEIEIKTPIYKNYHHEEHNDSSAIAYIANWIMKKNLSWYGDNHFHTYKDLITITHEETKDDHLLVIHICSLSEGKLPERTIKPITTKTEEKYDLHSDSVAMVDESSRGDLEEYDDYDDRFALYYNYILHLIPHDAKELLPSDITIEGPKPLLKKECREYPGEVGEIERIYFQVSYSGLSKTKNIVPIGIINALYVNINTENGSAYEKELEAVWNAESESSYKNMLSDLMTFLNDNEIKFINNKNAFISPNILIFDEYFQCVSAMPPHKDYFERLLKDKKNYNMYDSAKKKMKESIAEMIMKYKGINSITALDISFEPDPEYDTNIKFKTKYYDTLTLNIHTYHKSEALI